MSDAPFLHKKEGALFQHTFFLVIIQNFIHVWQAANR